MSNTTFVNTVTLTDAGWFQDVNDLTYGVSNNYSFAPALTAVANCSALSLVTGWVVKQGRLVTLNLSGTFTVTGTSTPTEISFPLPFTETGTGNFIGAAYYDGATQNPGVINRKSAGIAQIEFSAINTPVSGAGKAFSATLQYLAAS